MTKAILFSGVIFLVLFFASVNANCQEKNWTHFRGTNLNGNAENENIPLKWDDPVIKWKVEIHDKGYSSPVVYNDQIWLTTAKTDGKDLYAICIDFNTGKILYDLKIFSPFEAGGKHSVNTYATPTPCIEKGFVYVHYGNMGTACINTENGSVMWKRDDLKCKNIHGAGSSPIIYKNLIILHYDGSDIRYMVALDKTNGKEVWKAERPLKPYEPLTSVGKLAYITPLVINVKGKDLLISNGSAICQALDPNTGKEIWNLVDGAETTIAMPFTENGVLYWYSGFMVAPDGETYSDLLAVRPDGQGDIRDTEVIWKKQDNQSDNQMLSPVIKDGLIYTVTTRNNMMCIDAATGKELWSRHVNSNFNASPLYIDNNVWFFSIKGELVVLKAGRNYEIAAQNKMESGIWATPAVLRNSMIIRTENYLYRISSE